MLLLKEAHDNAGHFGRDATWQRLSANYWWPNIYQHTQEYVASCHNCQQHQVSTPINKPLNPIVVSGLFELWGIDFVGPIKESDAGNKYILVASEYFTKWPVVKAYPTNDAITVAQFLYKEIFCVFGPPL